MDAFDTPLVLEFGSRSGTYFALALFGTMFAVLAAAVFIAIGRRSSALVRWMTAGLLLVGPMTAIYSSSLGGFYRLEARRGTLTLHYLYPPAVQIPRSEVAAIQAVPAFRGRWRLHVFDSRGARYESATWHYDAVAAGATRVRTILGLARVNVTDGIR